MWKKNGNYNNYGLKIDKCAYFRLNNFNKICTPHFTYTDLKNIFVFKNCQLLCLTEINLIFHKSKKVEKLY